MNYWKPRNSALTIILGLLAAASTTAAIVLTSAGEYEQRRWLATNAIEQRGGVVTTDGKATALPPAALRDDPELTRVDRANDHHG
jgi:hypothetical protein